MEQQLEGLKKAAAAKSVLASTRAMEVSAQRPWKYQHSAEIDADDPFRPPKFAGGGDAGLKRLIGSGRRKGGSNGVMKGRGVISNLGIPIISNIAGLFGLGKKSCSGEEMSDSDSDKEEMVGSGKHQGKKLAKHLMELHGAGFLDDFAKGFMGVIKPAAGVLSMMPGTVGTIAKVASGILGNGRKRGRPLKGGNAPHDSTAPGLGHASMSSVLESQPGAGLGGSDVPLGGVAPQTYGNVPQAPASFKRNTVGMGRRKKAPMAMEMPMEGAGKLTITHGGKRKSARGQMIAKLMREKGMSLPEASRYLKAHGSA